MSYLLLCLLSLFNPRIPGFLESDECGALQKLCDSFVERDGEAVAEACGNVVFRAMETDVRTFQ